MSKGIPQVTGKAEDASKSQKQSSPSPKKEDLRGSGGIQVQFFNNGVSVGWLCVVGDGWCKLGSQNDAVTLYLYNYKGDNYYTFANTNYLSYLGSYDTLGETSQWTKAEPWTFANGQMLDNNGNPVCYWSTSDGYLYTECQNNSDYTPLQCTVQSV